MRLDIVEFRGAKREDAGAVTAIHDAAWRSTYQGIIPHLHLERMIARRGPSWWQRQIDRGSHIMLLEFDGMPQGYASFGRARGALPGAVGEIFELYISPPFQGVGLGKRLFIRAKHALQAEGFHKLVVWALKDNEMACQFYTALGGKITGTAPEKYDEVTLTRVAFMWNAAGK